MDSQIIRLNWRCNFLGQQRRAQNFRTLCVPKSASFQTPYFPGGMVLHFCLCVNMVKSLLHEVYCKCCISYVMHLIEQ